MIKQDIKKKLSNYNKKKRSYSNSSNNFCNNRKSEREREKKKRKRMRKHIHNFIERKINKGYIYSPENNTHRTRQLEDHFFF